MGKVKEKPKTFKESIHPIPEGKKPLPTPDTNPVDGDKLIKATQPKKCKDGVDIEELKKDLGDLGNWLADVDEDLKEVSDLVDRLAKRMGLHE
jgi:hypothetical protein|tara:strand:- start:167 stop:445 length:279 start_codon:yes stop_codon:yes gene_type:complete